MKLYEQIPPLITLRPGVGITPVNLIYIEGALRRMAWVARSRRTLLKSSYCSLKSFHLSCWAQNCRFAVTFRWYFRKQVFICSEATEHTCEGLDLNWDDISGKIRNLCALWVSSPLFSPLLCFHRLPYSCPWREAFYRAVR